jgi:TonB family protein
MESFALYLFKSVVWLAGFALVFILFLRNERFFFLNRIYLLAGILTSFFFPLISVHYTVILPIVQSAQTDNPVVADIQNMGKSIFPDLKTILLAFYAMGVLFVLTLMFRQGRSVLRAIKKSEIISFRPAKLIKTTDYTSAFSFFSYVFVNPSITDVETKEIMIHEMVHIRQKHWVDLLLVELLCMIQWFNPLVWIYLRFIRQNHEYLADEVALQQTSDPAIYKAVLLNQIVGAPVVSLTNSFNYSPNKKRFAMMKNIITSPYRKMKVLFILPVFALVLFSFARPDYKYKYLNDGSATFPTTSSEQKSVKGKVVSEDNKPLPGTSVTVRGTTLGSTADLKGLYKIDNVPEDGLLIFSFVGYKTRVLKPDFNSEMTVKMVRDTIKFSGHEGVTPPPPPPPVNNVKEIKDVPPPPDSPTPPPSMDDALYVVDGIITTKAEVDKISTERIYNVNVLKKSSNKYGEKGKNGVVEITTRKDMDMALVVIDGVIKDKIDGIIQEKSILSEINSDDIASTNVLQGQDAINKYGEKGKNGVVEITTKDYLKKLFTVIDGVVHEKDGMSSISMEDVKSLNVLTPELALKKYGEKAKDGAIEVTTYKPGDKRPEIKIDTTAGVTYSVDKKVDKRLEIKLDKKEDPFVVVEEMPQFPGGRDAMMPWIEANIKYPAEALKEKISGKVYVNFTVSTSGKVEDVFVTNTANALLNDEAKRVISSMPAWTPGKQAGKAVAVQYNVPVEFQLK